MNNVLEFILKLNREYQNTLPRSKRSNIRGIILKDIQGTPLSGREKAEFYPFLDFLESKVKEELK